MKRRILHIQKATGIGGAERHLLTLLPRLDRRKFQVELLLLTDRRRAAAEYAGAFESDAVRVDRVTIRSDLDPRCLLDVYRHVRGARVDLIHTHLIHADLYGGLAARLAGVPAVVSTRHNDDLFRRGRAMQALVRVTGWTCDRVIAVSGHMAAFARQIEGVAPHKIRSVHYGLAPAPRSGRRAEIRRELALATDAPLVAAVGRLTEQKGHVYLLRAWPLVIAVRPQARLVIIGDGPLRGRLTALAQELAVSHAVRFTGWRHDATDIVEAADAYAHPSLWEGFGLALLEAMAAGKAVVASRVSTIPEIVIDGETGWLVAPGDGPALAHALLRLLDDPMSARRMGEAGCRRVLTSFGVERMVRATEAVYEEILPR
jgi:glycosyltransferase involved in cell wall biosynthesis